MSVYREFAPHPLLQPYVVCYWMLQTGKSPRSSNIFSDGCSDIIFTLGANVVDSKTTMQHGRRYLVGIMTHCHTVQNAPDTHLVGIRFKPFGMHALLGITLQGTADTAAELTSSDLSFPDFVGASPSGANTSINLIQNLDTYLLQRLHGERVSHARNRMLVSLSETIGTARGNITVEALAASHHITERTVERLFQSYAGATVKEVCKQVRFQNALQQIKARPSASFAQIAFELGYYDHAHLLKDVKRYAGLTLSEIAT